MALDLDFDAAPTHARARVSGEGSVDEFLAVLRRIALVTAHTHPLLILDLRQLRGLEKLTEQMTAGLEAARQLDHARRVAVLEPAARVTFNGQKVARRLGLDLRVFAGEDEAQALAWLGAGTMAAAAAAPDS